MSSPIDDHEFDFDFTGITRKQYKKNKTKRTKRGRKNKRKKSKHSDDSQSIQTYASDLSITDRLRSQKTIPRKHRKYTRPANTVPIRIGIDDQLSNIHNIINRNNINNRKIMKNVCYDHYQQKIRPKLKAFEEKIKKHDNILSNIQNMTEYEMEKKEERDKMVNNRLNGINGNIELMSNNLDNIHKEIELNKSKQVMINNKLQKQLQTVTLNGKIYALSQNIDHYLQEIAMKFHITNTFRYDATHRNRYNPIYKHLMRIFFSNNIEQEIFDDIRKYEGTLNTNEYIRCPPYFYMRTKRGINILDITYYNDDELMLFDCDPLIREWHEWDEDDDGNIKFYQIWRNQRNGDWKINVDDKKPNDINSNDLHRIWMLRMIIKYQIIQ